MSTEPPPMDITRSQSTEHASATRHQLDLLRMSSAVTRCHMGDVSDSQPMLLRRPDGLNQRILVGFPLPEPKQEGGP